MSISYELGRVKMREWVARRHKKEALEKYAEAKSRVSELYITVQAAWEERRKACDELQRAFEATERAAGTVDALDSGRVQPTNSDELPSPQDAILAFRYAQAVFGRAKAAHKEAQRALRLGEFKRDRLQKELETATAEHDNVLKELKKCLAIAEGKKH